MSYIKRRLLAVRKERTKENAFKVLSKFEHTRIQFW